jgi:hypothetical protein
LHECRWSARSLITELINYAVTPPWVQTQG